MRIIHNQRVSRGLAAVTLLTLGGLTSLGSFELRAVAAVPTVPTVPGGVAAATAGIPATLTADLNIIAAPSGTHPNTVVDAAVADARAIFETYVTESDATWADYFTAYLQQAPIPNHFYGFLANDALTVDLGSAAKRERLQYALFTASTRTIRSMIDSSPDLKISFSDKTGFVQKINMLNYLVYDMAMDSRVTRDYKPDTLDLYDYLYNEYPDLLKKYSEVSDPALAYLNNFKEQANATMASIGKTNPALHKRAGLILGIDKVKSPYEIRLFDTYSLVVQDNGVLNDNQFQLMFDLMQALPDDYTKTAQIGMYYPNRAVIHGAKSTGAFTIDWARIGDYGGAQLNDGLEPNDFDYFISLFTHEYMHQIDGSALAKFPYLKDQKDQIIRTAGADEDNYIRTVYPGFYLENSQEFIAGNSNNYMAHTRRTFNHVVKKFHDTGRTTPMDTFLLLANIMSNGTNTSLGFEYGAGSYAKYTVTDLPVEKNAAGFITKITFGPCETYEFVLNDQNMVTDIISPSPVSQVPTASATCSDLDKDKDGILNTDEGYQRASLDFGSWGALAAPGAVTVTQPGTLPTKQVTVTLSSTGVDQRVELQPTSSLADRDLSGDGSALMFLGNYTAEENSAADIRFGSPVTDLTFDVTDVAGGNLTGPELLSIQAYRNGNKLTINASNLQSLVAGQSRPRVLNNMLNGGGAGSLNTQRVTFYEPVDRLVLSATGSTAQPVSTTIGVFNLRWSTDADGDGIASNYDLDADNDSCPDATEGTKNIALTSLDATGRVTGDIDATGIPLLANGGQGVGSAQNPQVTVAGCSGFKPVSILTVPATPKVIDDHLASGDAAYVLDSNNPTLSWTLNPDRSATVTITAANSTFPDGTTSRTFAAPVDIYVPPVATTTAPTTTTTTHSTSTVAPTTTTPTTTVSTSSSAPAAPALAPATTTLVPTTQIPSTGGGTGWLWPAVGASSAGILLRFLSRRRRSLTPVRHI